MERNDQDKDVSGSSGYQDKGQGSQRPGQISDDELNEVTGGMASKLNDEQKNLLRSIATELSLGKLLKDSQVCW